MALEKQGIRLLDPSSVHDVLTVGSIRKLFTMSLRLPVKVDNLPTGAMARTVLEVGRASGENLFVLAEYGKAGYDGTLFKFAVNFFSVYFCDLSYEPKTALGEWVALAMTYDGKNI